MKRQFNLPKEIITADVLLEKDEIIAQIINESMFAVFIAWALFIDPVGNAVEKAVRRCGKLLIDSILWVFATFCLGLALIIALPIFIFRVIFRVLCGLYRKLK